MGSERTPWGGGYNLLESRDVGEDLLPVLMFRVNYTKRAKAEWCLLRPHSEVCWMGFLEGVQSHGVVFVDVVNIASIECYNSMPPVWP